MEFAAIFVLVVSIWLFCIAINAKLTRAIELLEKRFGDDGPEKRNP